MSTIGIARDTRWWRGYGLLIRSAIAMPGAVPAERPSDGRDADIEIVRGVAPRWRATRTSTIYRVGSEDRFALAIPRVGRFTCLDRRQIVVDPAPGADATIVAEMLVATVLPALLWARGGFLLHAAAFAMPGAAKGIAVLGASGTGKSTAVARAVALGARAVADDSILIGCGEDGVVATGLNGGYFVRTGETRRFELLDAAQRASACQPGALIVLDSEATTIESLGVVASIEMVLRHRHRPVIARLLGLEAAMLPTLAEIAHAVPLITLPFGIHRDSNPPTGGQNR